MEYTNREELGLGLDACNATLDKPIHITPHPRPIKVISEHE
jgi:hypothetical protein